MASLLERKIDGDKITCLFNSKTILQTEYQVSKMLLEVTFRTGLMYRYHTITAMEHAGIQIAESAGQYFHKHLRSKRFEKVGAVPINEILQRIDKSKI